MLERHDQDIGPYANLRGAVIEYHSTKRRDIMALDKAQVLANAPAMLNRDDLPWTVWVEGDSIVACWKWMDARFFGADSVTDEAREFRFTATLKGNGKWKELDSSTEKSTEIGHRDGKLSFGASGSTFKGKQSQKSVSFGFGQDKKDGSIGMVKSSLDTGPVKDWVRGYLTQCGWKKAGLFG